MNEKKLTGNAWKKRRGSSKRSRTMAKKNRVLKVEPQFTLDELYRSPLTEERCYESAGGGAKKPQLNVSYVERKLPEVRLTGIRVMDEYVSYLAAGGSDMSAFCEERGLRYNDIDSLVFVLTGMRGIDFRQQYQLKMMNELLRYTSITPAEVARRSGIGSVNNLYLISKREYGEAPVVHRRRIRKPGDEGRYR